MDGSFFLGQFICPLVVLALAGAAATVALGLAARRRRTQAALAMRQLAG
ncbi:hypothetical protein ACFXKY_33585 [Streptomyces canus]